MTDFAGAEELEKYKRYIQKRRVSAPREIEAEDAFKKPEEDDAAKPVAKTGTDPYSLWDIKDDGLSGPAEAEEDEHSIFGKTAGGEIVSRKPEATLPTLRRHDDGIYKKLYSRHMRRQPSHYQSYKSCSSRAQIEDNRVSLIALRIIKQSLACFAILGIIIFMQSRDDMAGALEFVKRHLIETNIEPQNIFEGIKNIFYQCSRALGGAP